METKPDTSEILFSNDEQDDQFEFLQTKLLELSKRKENKVYTEV